jgi:uncharacterized protein (UPF0335 family)
MESGSRDPVKNIPIALRHAEDPVTYTYIQKLIRLETKKAEIDEEEKRTYQQAEQNNNIEKNLLKMVVKWSTKDPKKPVETFERTAEAYEIYSRLRNSSEQSADHGDGEEENEDDADAGTYEELNLSEGGHAQDHRNQRMPLPQQQQTQEDDTTASHTVATGRGRGGRARGRGRGGRGRSMQSQTRPYS